MKLKWIAKNFDDLTNTELYEIIALRTAVFVVEQNCPYQECDDKDQNAIHFYGILDQKIVAYARILPVGVSYSTTSIGRVVVHQKSRGKGLGYLLMKNAILKCYIAFGKVPITISAQEHLESYYSKLCFERSSDVYLEDNIPHIKMIKSESSSP